MSDTRDGYRFHGNEGYALMRHEFAIPISTSNTMIAEGTFQDNPESRLISARESKSH